MTETQTFDEEKVGALAERLIGALTEACVAMQISIGHQVGLFDLLAKLPAATSEEIADAAGLQERYVREWLGAMDGAGS